MMLTGGSSAVLPILAASSMTFFIQVTTTYRYFERSFRLKSCAKMASQSFYPDIRLGMDGSFRY